MEDRVYILLDTLAGRAERVVEVLRESPGVVMMDALEGPPDVLIMMAAPEREQLAKLTINALALVENLTEQVRLLPVRDELNQVGT